MKLNKHQARKAAVVLACCCMLIGVFLLSGGFPDREDGITADAESVRKKYRQEKTAVESGMTINAAYLWPDEKNPVFTAIYRDGEPLLVEKMVTITKGSVYHFHGSSDESILYMEVFVGATPKHDITEGESGTWYSLLPSKIREGFEAGGWTWEMGWEYTGRAYLDTDRGRILIKEDDPTAVLYGMGLYLDKEHGYSGDSVFINEGGAFMDTFGSTDNLFASALEYYYARGGELLSACPGIYGAVDAAVSGRKASEQPNPSAQPKSTGAPLAVPTPESSKNPSDEPVLVKGLLDYVNQQRTQAGLGNVSWDSANDSGIITRTMEIAVYPSQARPDGTNAFSAYTGSVMSEIRVMDADTVDGLFASAASYFLMDGLKSFNCAAYGNVAVLTFVW